VAAHDRGRITARTVADAFAALNQRVSGSLRDDTVGPQCIVAWRHRKKGIHKGGGGHQGYTGTARDQNNPPLPTIGAGTDIRALVEAMMPHFVKQFEGWRTGTASAELDPEAVNADLANLPDTPDEQLR
jgi:hypothetical protein